MTSIVSRVFLGLEPWLRRCVTHKELGWKEIGEKFTRFVLLKTRWLSVYLPPYGLLAIKLEVEIKMLPSAFSLSWMSRPLGLSCRGGRAQPGQGADRGAHTTGKREAPG